MKTTPEKSESSPFRPDAELEAFAALALAHLESDTYAGADGESLHSATYRRPAPFTVAEKRRVLEIMIGRLPSA